MVKEEKSEKPTLHVICNYTLFNYLKEKIYLLRGKNYKYFFRLFNFSKHASTNWSFHVFLLKINLILLRLPIVVNKAGLLLSYSVFFVSISISYISSSLLIEALSITNALM